MAKITGADCARKVGLLILTNYNTNHAPTLPSTPKSTASVRASPSKHYLQIITVISSTPSGHHHKGRHKKKLFFFSEKLRKGGRGVSPNPKFPYQKKMRFFWNFFLKGGGSHLFQKGVIIKNGDIGIFSPKRGLSPNP